jgi:hypothetical protein
MDENMMNMAPIHKSMESPALTGITTNYQERRIWHMHEQIDRIIDVEQIPPGASGRAAARAVHRVMSGHDSLRVVVTGGASKLCISGKSAKSISP